MRKAPTSALIVAVLCAIEVELATAGPLAPTKPSQIVTVMALASGASPCVGDEARADTVLNPDGTMAPFTIPPDQVLVVTSVDWNAVGGSPNAHHAFAIKVRSASPMRFAVLGAGAQADASGGVSGSVQIPTGFVVKPGVTLCAVALSSNAGEIPAPARLHGYLTKDK